jgi:hypothetical protein
MTQLKCYVIPTLYFACVPVYGVQLNHESKTFCFSFFKVLAWLKGLTWLT